MPPTESRWSAPPCGSSEAFERRAARWRFLDTPRGAVNNDAAMTDTAALAALRARLTDGRAAVGVAGLGYVGLPLAVELARAGFQVTGIDSDPERVRVVARGESPIEALPSAGVAEVVRAGRLRATSAWDDAHAFDAIIICVPTPLTPNREPDLAFVRAAGTEVARQRVAVPCSGSLFWRYHEMFDSAARDRAGVDPYIIVRDATCRLFGYHGLLAAGGAFSLDHMFGF